MMVVVKMIDGSGGDGGCDSDEDDNMMMMMKMMTMTSLFPLLCRDRQPLSLGGFTH